MKEGLIGEATLSDRKPAPTAASGSGFLRRPGGLELLGVIGTAGAAAVFPIVVAGRMIGHPGGRRSDAAGQGDEGQQQAEKSAIHGRMI